MAEVDAILIPTAPCVAPDSATGRSTVNGRSVNFGEVGVPLRIPVNLLGVPSLAVPTGFSGDLPISMQIIGRAWDEATILRIGQAHEASTPELRSRRPPHC
jgi:aspartyl-tRNA(Asn)/glutamyl-tRNA(Gln) amidotransferase subunit A